MIIIVIYDYSLFIFSEEAFNKIDTEFSKCNHFVITFLDNIVKRGAFPHREYLPTYPLIF